MSHNRILAPRDSGKLKPVCGSVPSSVVYAAAVFGLVFVLLGFASSFVNVDLFLLLVVAMLMVWLALERMDILVQYLYWLVIGCWSIIDVFILENFAMWSPNLQIYTSHQGSLFWLVFAEYVFVMSLCLYNKPSRKARFETELFKDLSYAEVPFIVGVVIIMTLSAVEALFTGYYAGEYSNRFEYIQSASTVSYAFRGYFFMLLPVVVAFALRRANRVLALGYLTVYLVFQVLIGNKFGPLFLAVWVFALTYVSVNAVYAEIEQRLYRRFLAIAVALCATLIAYSLVQMSLEHGSATAGFAQLLDRLSNGQGDVWWGIYANYSDEVPHASEIWDELGGLKPLSEDQRDYDFGIYKMMNLIAPDSVLNRYASRGSRFTASTDASLFYYFGPAGLLIGKALIALLLSVIVQGLMRSCRQYRLIDAFLFMWLLRYALEISDMSAFYLLVSPKFLVLAMALGLLSCARKQCAPGGRLLALPQ